MTFTTEEEEILKLMINELRTRMKLNAENVSISSEIRTEFGVTQTRIKTEHESILTPLQEEFNVAQLAIKEKFA